MYSSFSLRTQSIYHTKSLGDGDSTAHQTVVAETPYGPNISVSGLECTGHVQKRMEARLKRSVKEKVGTKLHDSKPLKSKGRLTQSAIEKLQNYYDLAIRMNVNSLEAMKRAAWTIFFTSCQQMRNPNVFLAQMVIAVGGNCRALSVQGLHSNLNFLY